MFANLAFTVILVAISISSVGIAMFDMVMNWLMTSLSPDPLMASAVQVATVAPMFLLTIPAGALADVVDPRRLLIGAQVGVVAVGVTFATLVGPLGAAPALLMTAFLLSAAVALAATAWRIITPMLVPKTELGDTITVSNEAIARADARRRPRLEPAPRTQRPGPVDRDLARPFAAEAQAPGGTGGQGRRTHGAAARRFPKAAEGARNFVAAERPRHQWRGGLPCC